MEVIVCQEIIKKKMNGRRINMKKKDMHKATNKKIPVKGEKLEIIN